MNEPRHLRFLLPMSLKNCVREAGACIQNVRGFPFLALNRG